MGILGDMKVLLVEDNLMLAGSVIALMERKGLDIMHCSDVSSALAALAESEFDLVVSDYSLGVSEKGDTVLRQVALVQPKAKRVMMSGEEDAKRFVESGEAQAFYLKDSHLARALVALAEAVEIETPSL